MTEQFTAADFASVIECAGQGGLEGSPYFYHEAITLAALRTAQRVMTEGVIEDGLMAGMSQRGAGRDKVAAAIRTALTREET